MLEDQARSAADDLEPLAVGRPEAAVEQREEAAGEAELADERPVDSALVEPGECRDGVRLATGDPPGDAHRVAADVPERAAAHRRIDPRVVRVVEEEREGRVDDLKIAERARAHDLERGVDLRVVEIHERLDGDPVVPRGRLGDRVDLRDAQGQRLLAQHVLARIERPDRPRRVEVVGQGDVDDVDRGIRQERLVGAIGRRRAVRGRERPRPLEVAAGHGPELAAGVVDQRASHPGRDPSWSDDSPVQSGHRRCCPPSTWLMPIASRSTPTRLDRATLLEHCTATIWARGSQIA